MDDGILSYEILTPRGVIAKGQCKSVTAPAIDGSVGILCGHSPYLAALDTGIVRMTESEKEESVFVDGGFIEVLEDKVVILAETAEEASKIDVNRAKAALERAGHFLEVVADSSREDPVDRLRARRAQTRAKFRLKSAGAA